CRAPVSHAFWHLHSDSDTKRHSDKIPMKMMHGTSISSNSGTSARLARRMALLTVGVLHSITCLSSLSLSVHAQGQLGLKDVSPSTLPSNDVVTMQCSTLLDCEKLDSLASPSGLPMDSFGIVTVADLDVKSKDEDSKKPLFYSYLQHGEIKIKTDEQTKKLSFSVSWNEKMKFSTHMNEAGRGFELSELAWFNGKLLAFDDRTGIVFRLKYFDDAKAIQAVPEHIIREGNGKVGKGQKHEWATVKDGELYMGSFGKEFANNDGVILSNSNQWVAILDTQGNVRHEDWTSHFTEVRKVLGCDFPGYVMHEAIEWSPVQRKWYILPRRVSTESYHDEADETRGSNKMVIASEDFSSIEVLEVGKVTPLRGFSSFKFLPHTQDQIIVAIKSAEIEAEQFQTSFITIFDVKGNVLMEETEIPGNHKKTKRKSSTAEPPMWTEQGTRISSNSGNSPLLAALARHKALLAVGVLVCFVLYSMTSSMSLSTSAYAHGHFRSNDVPPAPLVSKDVVTAQNPALLDSQAVKNLRTVSPVPRPRPDSFGIVVVADLDKKSKDEKSKKPLFYSYLQHGTIKIKKNEQTKKEDFSVSWGETMKFTTQMNEAGRGFELSELAWFNGKLLSFDDRTGIVFRLKDFDVAKTIQAVPEHIIMEGDGIAGKGQKHEWATVKDGELYMGSVGKEFTDNAGTVLSNSNLWVAVLDEQGNVRHEDWTSHFAKVRKALGCDYPGYVVHEAIEWSPMQRKWFILPRRVSTESYNDEADEKRGSNKMVIASEDFSSIEVLEVGKVTPLRGFSSFKFMPRTQDQIIVAIKSVEIEAEQFQTSFITIFDVKGNVLMEETELPGNHKFEGVAFAQEWS
ncbi:TPA: hypothetical protein N0F65_000317, partial [Lagenidium giganteum]